MLTPARSPIKVKPSNQGPYLMHCALRTADCAQFASILLTPAVQSAAADALGEVSGPLLSAASYVAVRIAKLQSPSTSCNSAISAFTAPALSCHAPFCEGSTADGSCMHACTRPTQL